MSTPSTLPLATGIRRLDAESHRWVQRLGADGLDRETAIGELHVLLLRASRFEVARRRAVLGRRYDTEHEDLAQQSADDALMAVLGKLDQFRGDSRFTTWAYKFALYEAAVKVRRRVWHQREVELRPEHGGLGADLQPSVDDGIQMRELLAALTHAIEHDLSTRQREVLVSVTLHDVPIDVLAERLHSTRGALYKTLHDARRKLRASLEARGISTNASADRQVEE